ncbi:Swt1 family HEPN domain-containing protein [Paucibacter sp. M5-1]|uniref:Swt1 family HEPN domain-containing protein n=1 Tax=Paucibacter sp. M5-1 TaxID=3015998 RepID=UPI0022B8D349|nr:Swt1 family HEPN domain-containing protein [Paucibacter sp. M5-1]MCZ7884229.1 Swt1 family HEPN domain-containing protein [Paucibacter sp. M5-1]
MSDEVRRLLEAQARQKALLDPYVGLTKYVEPSSALQHAMRADRAAMEILQAPTLRSRMLADLIPHSLRDVSAEDLVAKTYGGTSSAQDAMLALSSHQAVSPLAEARQLGLLDPAHDLHKSVSSALAASRAFEEQFRLPSESEIERMAREALEQTDLRRMFVTGSDTLQQAMARMHSPWVQIDHAASSAKAFADLVGIGRGLAQTAPYDAPFVASLRASLGDWRDTRVPQHDLVDPIVRLGLYRERGLDPELTDFTSAAFRESLGIAGLSFDSPSAAPVDPTAPTSGEVTPGDEHDAALTAFGALRSFEVIVRQFITQRLQAAYGSKWPKRGLPADVLTNCKDKKERGEAAGDGDLPLLDYADFTDYIKIIDRGDNWKSIFESVFPRREDVKESFQRLGPVRIATMHSRMVLREDQLMLAVETQRVLKAINAAPAQTPIGVSS